MTAAGRMNGYAASKGLESLGDDQGRPSLQRKRKWEVQEAGSAKSMAGEGGRRRSRSPMGGDKGAFERRSSDRRQQEGHAR